MVFAVVRVRGTVNVRGEISDTLRMMRLRRVNHCILLPENHYSKGMLQKVKDYVTWGEIKPETLTTLLEKRARLAGNKELDQKDLEKSVGFKTLDAFSQALVTNKVALKDVRSLKPLFRLHPPRKGWEGIKRSYSNGGALGYRGNAINELLMRML